MKSFSTIALAILASQATAKTFQVALTGYYNGIDTIGGSGSTAHFKYVSCAPRFFFLFLSSSECNHLIWLLTQCHRGVKVNCVGGSKKELCSADDSGITCKGDKDQGIDCNGLALHYAQLRQGED